MTSSPVTSPRSALPWDSSAAVPIPRNYRRRSRQPTWRHRQIACSVNDLRAGWPAHRQGSDPWHRGRHIWNPSAHAHTARRTAGKEPTGQWAVGPVPRTGCLRGNVYPPHPQPDTSVAALKRATSLLSRPPAPRRDSSAARGMERPPRTPAPELPADVPPVELAGTSKRCDCKIPAAGGARSPANAGPCPTTDDIAATHLAHDVTPASSCR